jgi:nucleoside 2-deoxyribosyltransferase
MKTKLYIGCSLTHASEEFKTSVENLKDILRTQGYEVFDFVGLVNGTAKDVYEWDINHCIKDCDAFIGICDFPSIGLGWEANQAIRLGKPALGVAHKDAHVTRLILGAAEVEPDFGFERYEDLVKDVPPMVERLIKKSE